MSKGFSLKSALSDIHAAQGAPETMETPTPTAKATTAKKQPTRQPITVTRAPGKSSHPDYASLKIYVRKETRRKAERKWEDAGSKDLSDLIETLLSRYVGS